MSELKKPDGAQPGESVNSAASARKPDKAEKAAKADKTGKKAPPAKKKGEGVFKRLTRWFKELKGELKKVTWPSAKDTMKNVGVVIVCVLIVGALIWVSDFIIRQVVDALLNLFG